MKRSLIYRIIDRKTDDFIFMGKSDEVGEYLRSTPSKTYEILAKGTHDYKVYEVAKIYEYRGVRGSRRDIAKKLGLAYASVATACFRDTAIVVGHTFKPRGVDADMSGYAVYKGEECIAIGSAAEITELNLFTTRAFYEILQGKRPYSKYQVINLDD